MEMNATISETENIYNQLLRSSQGTENDRLLAIIIASWTTGNGDLPQWLGLTEDEFNKMLIRHFPRHHQPVVAPQRDMMDEQRDDEREEVLQLFLQHRAGLSETEEWIAKIVTAACQGQDHLWQDLGVWSRQDLSNLLWLNFPELARKNDKDMKWKKFVYKQLCITEGIYTCRAPSCEVCADYDNCFGPED